MPQLHAKSATAGPAPGDMLAQMEHISNCGQIRSVLICFFWVGGMGGGGG